MGVNGWGNTALWRPRQTANSALKVNRCGDVASSFCDYAPECAPTYLNGPIFSACPIEFSLGYVTDLYIIRCAAQWAV